MSEFLSDTFGATGGPSFVNTIYPPLKDTFGAKGTFYERQRRNVHEIFGVSGKVIRDDAYLLIQELIGVRDSTSVFITVRRNVLERFRAQERVVTARVRYITTTADSFKAVGGFASEPKIGVRLRDRFGAQDTPTGFVRTLRVISEVFGVKDRAIARNIGILGDVFVARGAGIEPSLRGFLKDVFYARTESLPRVVPRAFIREKALVRGQFFPVAHLRHVVYERFTIYDEVRGRERVPASSSASLENFTRVRTDVWTADMRTWAMSRYIDFPLSDFVGTQFGAGEDGLYTGSLADVYSYIETGKLRTDDDEDRKLHQRKQPRYVYVYGTYTQPLNVLVSADVNGELTQFEYQLDRSDVESERASRCEVGRGFASNYIKLRVGGSTRFTISALEIESVPSTRRI